MPQEIIVQLDNPYQLVVTPTTEVHRELLEVGVPGPQGIQGSQGPQGTQGPPGIPGTGTGDANFIFTQMVAQSVWTIVHGMNKYPSVTVVDSGGSIVTGDVEYLSLNSVRITFTASFSGEAYLN